VGKPGKVHRLDITLKDGVNPESALAEIGSVVIGRAEVESAREQDNRIREVLKGIEIGFKLCGAGALVVGLFLVYNALSVSVAERRHDIGIMRSVGATRPQVRLLFLAEALLLGVVGTGLGLPLGLGIAWLSLGPLRDAIAGLFLPLQPREIEVEAVMLVTAALGGLATALLAALVPASQAAAEEPADAVRRTPPRVSVAYGLLRVGGSLALVVPGALLMAFKPYLSAPLLLQVGGLLIVVGVPLALIGWRRLSSARVGPAKPQAAGHSEWSFFLGGIFVALAGAALVLLRDALPGEKGTYVALSLVIVGSLLLIPSLASFATRLVQPLARAVLPVEGRLAADNLVRNPGRTGLVIAAVAAGVALTVQTAGLIRSNEDAFLTWIDDTLRADLYLRSGGLTSSAGHQKTMSEKVVEDLRRAGALPSGSQVVGLAYRFPNYDSAAGAGAKTKGFMVLLDARDYCNANRERMAGHPDLAKWRRLAEEPDGAIVSENFARMHGVSPGDTLTLPGGTLRRRVIDTVVDYNWIRGTIFLDRGHNREALSAQGVHTWEVYLPPGADPKAVVEGLGGTPVGARYSLIGVTREQVRSNYRQMVRTLYGLAYTQELVVAVVAVLGVVLSLLISVLSRQRELGLLRAVGGTRGQVVYTVLAEGVLVGTVGAVLGILIGLPLEWYVVRVILFEEAGFLFAVKIPWLEVGVISLLSVGLATLASLLPALHAMRLNITDAIAYE
jgi:ABC-type antimicrobial peptide transport system permease subunit